MYCPECGNELLGKVKFCHECGFNILKYINESDNQGGSQEIQEPDPPLVDPSASSSAEISEEPNKVNQIVPKPDDRDNLLCFNNNYKIDIAAMIVLHIVTAGLYLPIWLYRRYEMFELRLGTRKIHKGTPKAAIWFCSLLLCTRFILFFVDSHYHDDAYMTLLVFELIFWALYLLFFYTGCYRIRAILNEMMELRTVSSVWTFVFPAFYLQYKMNRLGKWSDSPTD